MTDAADKIIIALDVATEREAVGLVERLRDKISFFKIGLQLYTAEGPKIVKTIRRTGAKVFLDLKLHDIPNTVEKAVTAASGLDVQMLTIHLSGGGEMISAAVRARTGNMSILGVTVLTSMNDKMLNEVGIESKTDDQVLRLAKIGNANGVDGLVASARELATLRSEFGNKMKIIVPGIRPAWAQTADQKRTMTPRAALEAGADYLVIGRPVTEHQDPLAAINQLLEEIIS